MVLFFLVGYFVSLSIQCGSYELNFLFIASLVDMVQHPGKPELLSMPYINSAQLFHSFMFSLQASSSVPKPLSIPIAFRFSM